MISYLEFEKPVAELEQRIAELRSAAEGDDVDITNELQRLELKSANLLASTYQALSPWQKTQVARHPSRPHFRDYMVLAQDAPVDLLPPGFDEPAPAATPTPTPRATQAPAAPGPAAAPRDPGEAGASQSGEVVQPLPTQPAPVGGTDLDLTDLPTLRW